MNVKSNISSDLKIFFIRQRVIEGKKILLRFVLEDPSCKSYLLHMKSAPRRWRVSQ